MIQRVRISDLNEALTAISGKVRGRVLLSSFDYIEKREGAEGVRRIEEELNFLKHSISRSGIKKRKWYKEGLSVLVIMTAQEFFFYRNDDVFDMGVSALSFSLLQKTIFFKKRSLSHCVKEIKGYWKDNYDFGSVDVVDLIEKERSFKIRLYDYRFHSLIVREYIRGCFFALIKRHFKDEDVSIELIKSVFQGDSFNEYKVFY